jgi:Domain of unknown function (DUF4404)
MPEEDLRTLIGQLRAELAGAHDLGPETRAELHDLVQALEEAGTLRERLSDRMRLLEASHPKLSHTIGNVVDTLAFYNL